MLITNWGSLKAELSRTMFQVRFVPEYDMATQNFEATANRRLRVRPMEVLTALATTGGSAQLPADYLLWRSISRSGAPRELDYVHPAFLNSDRIVSPSQVFTIEGNTLKVKPADDTVPYEFHYYQRIPTVINATNDSASNWLILAHPDLYYNGVLYELFLLGRNGEMAVAYKGLRDEKFAEVIRLYSLTTGATSPMVREAEYF